MDRTVPHLLPHLNGIKLWRAEDPKFAVLFVFRLHLFFFIIIPQLLYAQAVPRMARLLRRLQRCFRRKPMRFFTFFLLYLMAGSLVFLHAVFSSDNSTQLNIAWNVARGSAGGVGKGTHGTTGQTGLSWTKDSTERGSDHTKSWNPDPKARTIKESDDGRGE